MYVVCKSSERFFLQIVCIDDSSFGRIRSESHGALQTKGGDEF